MSANILNIVYGKIDSDLLKNISTILNEDSVKTQLAFKAAVAALLGGMIKKSVSMDGAEQIFRTVDSLKPVLFDNYEELVKNDHQALVKAGNAIASKVFGSHRGVFVDSIGKYAGIKLNSSKTLVSLVGPLIVGAVQEQKTEQSLKRTGIVNLLAEQKDSLAGQLPTSLSQKFGFTEFTHRGAQRAAPATALPQKSFSTTTSSAKIDSEAAEELRKKFAFGSTKSVASIPSSTQPQTPTPTVTPSPSPAPAAEAFDADDSSTLDLDSSATIPLSANTPSEAETETADAVSATDVTAVLPVVEAEAKKRPIKTPRSSK